MAIAINTILATSSTIAYYKLYELTDRCRTEGAEQRVELICNPRVLNSILVALQIGPSYPLPHIYPDALIYSRIPVVYSAVYNFAVFLLLSSLIYGLLGAFLFSRFKLSIAILLLILLMTIATAVLTLVNYSIVQQSELSFAPKILAMGAIIPKRMIGVDSGSRPTQRAADKWDSPRFQAVFNTSAGFRFRASSASRPLAANASRSAALRK